MSEKSKKLNTGKKPVGDKFPRILIGCGVGLLIVGFIVLSKVNRMADNWAGFAAPVILVISWILIGVGLWKIEK